MRCGKCEKLDDNPITLAWSGVCDLNPVFGYSGACVLKLQAGIIDFDDGEDGATVKGRKKGKKKSTKR